MTVTNGADRREMRHGVALLTVMMTLVLIAAVAAAGRAQVGAGLAAIERSGATVRARWRAEGCSQLAFATLNAAVHSRGDTAWNELGAALSSEETLAGGDRCELAIRPLGSTFDVGRADSGTLVRLFLESGILPQRADSLIAAVLDWNDSDTQPRLAGAERTWYRAQNRPQPRDSRVRNFAEIQLIRGFENPAFLSDTVGVVLGADSLRIDLRHAPLPVLLSLPELAEPIARELDRTRSSRTTSASSVVLSGASGALGLAAVKAPERWLLIVRVREPGLASPFELRTHLGRAGDRLAVMAVEEAR